MPDQSSPRHFPTCVKHPLQLLDHATNVQGQNRCPLQKPRNSRPLNFAWAIANCMGIVQLQGVNAGCINLLVCLSVEPQDGTTCHLKPPCIACNTRLIHLMVCLQRINLDEGASVNQMPLVVLLNGNSASASEILAGALHDNHRASLIGDSTYGKGKIQSVFELADGSALFVTVAK